MHEVCNIHITQDTSRMETARVKQEEEADTNIIVKEEYEIWKDGAWEQRGKDQIKLPCVKDLTIKLCERRKSLYHRLD